MIPKSRLDALTDGVFAVAMTLLVIDLRLPEGFHPADARELLQNPQSLRFMHRPSAMLSMVRLRSINSR